MTAAPQSSSSGTNEPFGYLIEKAGVRNGYSFVSTAEFACVEERFQHLYKPISETPLTGDILRRYLRGSEALAAEARATGETEASALDRLVEIADRAHSSPTPQIAGGVREQIKYADLPKIIETIEGVYNFQCEAGALTNCGEWKYLKAVIAAHLSPQAQVGETLDRLAPAIEAAADAVECWSIVEQLRANEGAEVILLCDNPDFNGQSNNAIAIVDDWTMWSERRFNGDTMLDALRAAKAAHDAHIEIEKVKQGK